MQTTTSSELIETIRRFHADRRPSGFRRKLVRMAEGAFEFFRGTDFLFARAWPELKPGDPGPAVLICGDLHLENFGAFLTDDGDFRFDINDFDEAVVAPCSLDLVRCSTSILLAAESWRLTPTQATGMVLEFLDNYHRSIRQDGDEPIVDGQPPLGSIGSLLWATAQGTTRGMLKRYTVQKNGSRRIRHRKNRITGISAKNAQLIRDAVTTFGWTQNWKVLDVARRHAGIGSLGLRRFLVLLQEGEQADPLVLDVKEAAPSALRDLADVSVPPAENEAERIVSAQRQLQAKPTARLAALQIGDRWYRLRAMVPEENQSSLARLRESPTKLREAVAAAGRLTARSQHRGSHIGNIDRFTELKLWADSPALESVLAAAVRFADWVQRDYDAFLKAYRDGEFG
ncbi:MAG TPA: DUF2252 family protein [Gemmataceae bacterium]|jgi:uncharacterized protein (DUF2252 family)|nr:DUF2252 family protein [Gemmataceae bacterium]